MDFNEKGQLRNVFWADSNARTSYDDFGDVIAIDTSCLVEKYEVPIVVFSGLNHHGHTVQLGSGLVAGETEKSYTWLFRAWLTFISGPPPRVVIIDQSKPLPTALADVFPRAFRCLSLSDIIKKLPEKLSGLDNYEVVYMKFVKTVYHSMRINDFESAWRNMTADYRLTDHTWLQTLYVDRKSWVPAYLKDTFFGGMFPVNQGEELGRVFDGYLRKDTSIIQFFDEYRKISEKIKQKEASADMESRNLNPVFNPRCSFELQVSKVYTNGVFEKFRVEIDGMLSCFNTRQVGMDGSLAVYLTEKQTEDGKDRTEYEVLYDSSKIEVRCVCGLFNFKGYLCRHALDVFRKNGVEEIPPRYILRRWRKDVYRPHGIYGICHGIDLSNPIRRYDELYKRVEQVVEKGSKSQEKYKFALHGLEEILSKVKLIDDETI